MGTHNNVHVPKESWPAFAWYAIEFLIVLAAGLLIAQNSMNYFQRIHFTDDMKNWAFWGIVGGAYLVYYLIARPLLLKRPILRI